MGGCRRGGRWRVEWREVFCLGIRRRTSWERSCGEEEVVGGLFGGDSPVGEE